jgi:PucR C-terminal helix-turn-helix domain/GGDEF-like domain
VPDLQRTIDELATRLCRPVLLEDRRQQVIAYTEQTGPMDEVRRESILRRHTTPEVRRWLRAEGIFESRTPLHIPAAPELGLLPRVCVPAWHDGRLLGFLWLIDASPPMSDREVAVAARAAPGLALTLFHNDLVSGLTSRRELEAVTGVLLGDGDEARSAAQVLIESGDFPQAEPVTAMVLRPLAEPAEPLRLALEQGLLAVRFRFLASHPVHLVRYDHAVLLCAGPPVDPAEIHAAVTVPVVIGVGRSRPRLADAAQSYVEAQHAAEVAARIPGIGRTADWSSLGVYRLLTKIPPAEGHAGLERLFADPQHLPLLHTLETYLDLAGSADATAKALRLHRTSLYYRLHRVEKLANTDLKSGDERLILHLSLKLARLAGRYPPRA